jgi:hypothetical protein
VGAKAPLPVIVAGIEGGFRPDEHAGPEGVAARYPAPEMRARRSGDDRRRREGLGSRMRPELGVAAHAEPSPRRPKRVGGLRLHVDLRADEGRHGDARKQPLIAEHGMGLSGRPEVGCLEAAADRGAADADAPHGDEAVAIERAGESALQAGAQKGGMTPVEASEQNRVQLTRRRGVVLRKRCFSRGQKSHDGKRRARTSRPNCSPRPTPHGYNPTPALVAV